MVSQAEIDKIVAAGIVTGEQGVKIGELLAVGSQENAYQAISFAPEAPKEQVEKPGLSFAKTLYYLGGFLIVFSLSYFLGSNWEKLGDAGRIISTLVIALGFLGAGIYLKQTAYKTAGSMLLLASMVAVPLCIHSIERALGLWPTGFGAMGSPSYANFLGRINTAWVVLDGLTLVVALAFFKVFKDAILTLPVAHFFWFLVLDATNFITGGTAFDFENMVAKSWVSIAAGALLVAWGIYYHRKQDEAVGVWPWIFGLAIMFGSLVTLRFDVDEVKLLYQILILAFGLWALLAATPLRSRTFLTFGSLAIFWFIQDIAWTYFTGSLGFSVVLMLSGLLTIGFGIGTQKYYKQNFTS